MMNGGAKAPKAPVGRMRNADCGLRNNRARVPEAWYKPGAWELQAMCLGGDWEVQAKYMRGTCVVRAR
jgi:hypothetical protein